LSSRGLPGSSSGLRPADTSGVSRERTLEKIMAAFAEAVAAGDFEKAEGWLAVASFARNRVVERGHAPTR
jgi:hypothetical protein